MQLEDILRTAIGQGASDIHLISGHPPMMRVNTVITPMDYPILTPESVQAAMEEMATEDEHHNTYARVKDLDFSYEIKGLCRFRVNAHSQRGTCGVVTPRMATRRPLLSTNIAGSKNGSPSGPRTLAPSTGKAASRRRDAIQSRPKLKS